MFGKPKTAEEALRIIQGLSEEEKTKLLSALNSEPSEANAETESETSATDEQPEETVKATEPETNTETAEETAEEFATEPTGETLSEELANDGTIEDETSENEQPNEDRGEVIAALTARLDALEAKFASLEQINAENVSKDNNQDFGFAPSLPDSVDEDSSRMSAVMESYAGRKAKNYY